MANPKSPLSKRRHREQVKVTSEISSISYTWAKTASGQVQTLRTRLTLMLSHRRSSGA